MRYILFLLCLISLGGSPLSAKDKEKWDAKPTKRELAALQKRVTVLRTDMKTLREKYTFHNEVYHPYTNPYSKEKIQLGKLLFFDPRLSGNNKMSCATCHNPAKSWSDGRPRAVGNGGVPLKRRTPELWNMAFQRRFFWDSRARNLEQQALGPITAEDEMNQNPQELVRELQAVAKYKALFQKAFPKEKDPITIDTITKAIAAFERTIVSGETPFDRWLAGDEKAVSAAAKKGFLLFNDKANCFHCHGSHVFSVGNVEVIGLKTKDKGMGTFRKGADFLFKTPTLRNVAKKSHFMHDGQFRSLEEVIEFYNRGGDQRKNLSIFIKPLNLTADEKKALVAFLKSLTSNDPLVVAPDLP